MAHQSLGSSPASSEPHGESAHPPLRPLGRLRELFATERRELGAIVLFAFGVAVLSLATPIAIEALVNTVAFGVLLQPVLILSLVLFGCLALAAMIRALQALVVEYLQQRIFVRVVSDFARRLPRVRLEAYEREYGPDVLNRFLDVINVQKSAASLLLDGVAIVVSTLVGMIVLAFYHPALLGFDIALLIALAFLVFGLGRGGVRTGLAESHAKYETAVWLEEIARLPRTFKFYGGSQLVWDRAEELTRDYVHCRRRHFRVVWRQILFALALQVLVSSFLLGLGGWLVIERELNLGQLVAAELIVTLIVGSFTKLGKEIATFYDLCTGVEKLGKVTGLALEPASGEAPTHSEQGMALRVDLSQIGVGHGIWEIRPAEKVAITGRPGTGKSRLLDLVCGLREPTYGQVRVDGIDLHHLRLEGVRERIALVKEAEIIGGTVLDNLRVGREHLDLAEVRRALDAVGLQEAIQALPRGLETRLVPDGYPLSSSQALRLSIARGLLGRPRLLILDGVLDGLNLTDSPGLLPTLFDPTATWTLLVVTSREDVIARCDRTVSLNPGDADAPL